MKERRIKKPVIVSLYMASFFLLLGSIVYMNQIGNQNLEEPVENEEEKVINIEEDLPVANTTTTLIRPYTAPEVKVLKNFYDYKADNTMQENSILYYENTYIQNSGTCYGETNIFDVIAVAGGEVTDVKEDELLGKIVEVTHENNVISLYQSLSDVSVEKGDKVIQGQLLGKSGTSNLEKDLNNHLHFELIVDGKNVNPEEYYNKDINEL